MARGTIKDGDDVLFENVEISLTTKGGSPQFSEWYGSFRLPRGGYIDPAGENYQLELDDGRAGQIFIRRVDGRDMQFRGSGELKKPEPPEQSGQGTTA